MSIVVEFEQLALVDGADAQLALDGRDEGRPLEERAGQGFQRSRELSLTAGQLVVEADPADVFFAGALLRFHEAGGAVEADDEAAGDFGIERPAVTGLFDSALCSLYGKHFDPGEGTIRTVACG